MKKKGRRVHTKEFKEEAVKLVQEQGYPVAEAARNLGVSPSILGRWKRELEKIEGGETNPGSMANMQAELKRLRKKNKRLEMEREILKKAGHLLRERIRMRYQFIDIEKQVYPIVLICEVMRVSCSGYYSWRSRKRSAREIEDEQLIPIVKAAARASRRTYGTRRIVEEINENGHSCGRDKARRLMKLAGVSVRRKKKFKVTTDSNHKLPVSPNLLARKFSVSAPDRVWVSDITYLWTSEGWLYLAVILDLFQRKVVGWSMSHRINKQLVMDALRMGIWRCRPKAGLIFHSDRGSQYCSHDFLNLLKTHNMLSSMSRKGNCWDNAVAESFFGSLKTEWVYFTKYTTREEARRDVVDYIEMFYNSKRRHSYLGYLSPMEFEKKWHFKKAA
ncbi:MAG: IS3 family transposase [bacterium]